MTTVTAIDGEALAHDLKGRVRGPLLTPGDPAYDAARSVWNGMIDRRPAVIARCLGVADVIACVEVARARGADLCIKGGGHNIAGLAVRDGGLLLDMSLMRGVWVDPGQRLARAQAGCLLGDVDRETQLHGLAAVLGFVSNTGCAGLTLGGGFGYLTRRFGWTSDNLTAVDLVTADGRMVRASERENADLFWAVRGGGGNFGVATGFSRATTFSDAGFGVIATGRVGSTDAGGAAGATGFSRATTFSGGVGFGVVATGRVGSAAAGDAAGAAGAAATVAVVAALSTDSFVFVS